MVEWAGVGTVESWTTPFNRTGSAEKAFLAVRTPEDARVLAVIPDAAEADATVRDDIAGAKVQVNADGTATLLLDQVGQQPVHALPHYRLGTGADDGVHPVRLDGVDRGLGHNRWADRAWRHTTGVIGVAAAPGGTSFAELAPSCVSTNPGQSTVAPKSGEIERSSAFSVSVSPTTACMVAL